MKSKILIFFLVGIVLITGCDNRKDFFVDTNNNPQITLSTGENSYNLLPPWVNKENLIQDTVKFRYVSIYDDNAPGYRIKLNIKDEENPNVCLKVTDMVLGTHIFQNGEDITDSLIEKGYFIPKGNEFVIKADSTFLIFNAKLNITFTVFDKINYYYQFEEPSSTSISNPSVEVSLDIIDNLPPVAKFTSNQTNQFTNYEVEFDASSSFDRDVNYGGKILRYYFELDSNYRVEKSSPVLNRVFPAAGTYSIRVKVMDDDSVWSPFETQSIIVN